MAIRLWRIPDRYPNKHVGVYRDPDDNYLQFREGKWIEPRCKFVFDFTESTSKRLQELGCLWNNIRIPLVNKQIGMVLNEWAERDVQLLPTQLLLMDGETEEYSLVNVTSLSHCLDFEKSVVQYFDEGPIKGISRLRFRNDECLDGHNLSHLAESKGRILVSETLYVALSKLTYGGCRPGAGADMGLCL